MKTTPTLIILLLSTGLAVVTPSSTITNFGYDAAGNRTTRIIDQQNFNPTNVEEKESYKDLLAGHEIKIFPNPSRQTGTNYYKPQRMMMMIFFIKIWKIEILKIYFRFKFFYLNFKGYL